MVLTMAEIYGGLFAVACVAGGIDAIAGGGGLLTVPALMSVGLDPAVVLATNKMQGFFGLFSATLHFWREGRIRWRDHIVPMSMAFFASALGASLLVLAEPHFIKKMVPFLLIAIAVLIMLNPRLGHVQQRAKMSARLCGLTLVPLVGAYDGFFGPGGGTFYAFGLVSLLGVTLQEATFRAKLYNLASNLGGLSCFLIAGHIAWDCAIVMIAGTVIGSQIGARLVVGRGVFLIKPMLVIMSLAMSVKLLWASV